MKSLSEMEKMLGEREKEMVQMELLCHFAIHAINLMKALVRRITSVIAGYRTVGAPLYLFFSTFTARMPWRWKWYMISNLLPLRPGQQAPEAFMIWNGESREQYLTTLFRNGRRCMKRIMEKRTWKEWDGQKVLSIIGKGSVMSNYIFPYWVLYYIARPRYNLAENNTHEEKKGRKASWQKTTFLASLFEKLV